MGRRLPTSSPAQKSPTPKKHDLDDARPSDGVVTGNWRRAGARRGINGGVGRLPRVVSERRAVRIATGATARNGSPVLLSPTYQRAGPGFPRSLPGCSRDGRIRLAPDL